MTGPFTADEINLICIYNTDSRDALISEMLDAIDDFYDDEIIEIAVSALDKVTKMSDGEFDALELYPTYDKKTEGND